MTLRADLHIHSSYSDGIDSVKKILRAALEKKLDAISITDHDTVNGSLEAMEIVEEEKLPLVVIPGVEISTSDGHLLAYGVYEDLEPGRSMRETALEVKRIGGISAIAHPFQFYRHGIINITKAIDVVDAIEVFNAKFYIGLCNALSAIISRRYDKPVIAGSDAHSSQTIGYGITILHGAGNSQSAIQSIRLGKTGIEGRRIPLTLQLRTSLTRTQRWVDWRSKE